MTRPARYLALLATLGLCACGFRGLNKPVAAQVNGHVYLAETGKPIPQAEVCAFGEDTTCVRANDNGFYRLYLTAQTVTLRFRFSRLAPPGLLHDVHVGTNSTSIDCTLTNRPSASGQPIPCLPRPASTPNQ